MTLDKKLKVFVMASGGATSGRELVKREVFERCNYEVIGFFFSKNEASGIKRLENDGFKGPVIVSDVHEFYKDRGHDSLKDRGVRAEYEADFLVLLSERELEPDLICLSGYMLVSVGFHNKIPTINVHPADLAVLDEDGHRRFTGDNAVYDVIKAGESYVMSTIHLVTDGIDAGPIIVRSKPIYVHQWVRDNFSFTDKLSLDSMCLWIKSKARQIADGLQEEMKLECDNPAYLAAVNLIADGDVCISDGNVYRRLPREGITLE